MYTGFRCLINSNTVHFLSKMRKTGAPIYTLHLCGAPSRGPGNIRTASTKGGKVAIDNFEKNNLSFSARGDGSKMMTVADQTLVIGMKTMDALSSKYGKIFDRRFSLSSFGYPKIGFDILYQMVMECFPSKKTEALVKWGSYFDKVPEDKLVIMHLNDNRLDFNIENLMWGPRRLKLMMRKSQAQQRGTQYRGQVTIQGIQRYTNLFPTKEEALHHVDILKLTSPNVPKEFLGAIYLHGMNRPTGFEQYYHDIETLMARANLSKYWKRSRSKKVHKPRIQTSMARYEVFHSIQAFLEDGQAPEKLRDIIVGEGTLSQPGCEPFSEEKDCILLYLGARGKKVATVLEQSDLPLLEGRGIGNSTGGYVKFFDGEQEYLHHAIMGCQEGKQIGHGPGRVLDNRRRTLKYATSSEINSFRRAPSKSQYSVGVFEKKHSVKKWQARLDIFGGKAGRSYLGNYATEAEAAAAVSFAVSNKVEFRLRTVNMDEKARKVYVLRCCRAQILFAMDRGE